MMLIGFVVLLVLSLLFTSVGIIGGSLLSAFLTWFIFKSKPMQSIRDKFNKD